MNLRPGRWCASSATRWCTQMNWSVLSAEAKALEASGDLRQARERWLTALPLLPPTSTQADWIKQHARTLDADADAGQAGRDE